MNAVLYEKIRMKDVLKMNKGRQLQVAQVCRELKGIEKEIARRDAMAVKNVLSDESFERLQEFARERKFV